MRCEDFYKIIERLIDDQGERLEGLEAIRRFIDPTMSRTNFYRYHREALRPFLIERRNPWRKTGSGSSPKPKFFSYKRLLMLYLLKRRVI